MSLTLVVGRPNSGKTGVLHDVVRRSVTEGVPATVALPSWPDVRLLTREFALHGPQLGVTVTTLDAHIDAMWAMWGDGRAIVGEAEQALLLRRAADACNLEILARSAGRRGFVRMLRPLADVAPSSQEAAAAQEVEAAKHLSARRPRGIVGEVRAILEEYQTLLENSGRIERAQAVAVLAKAASPEWYEGPLVINRFTDLTPAQENFVRGVSRHVDVWMSLPWQEGFPATQALDPLVDRLRESGAELRLQEPRSFTHSPELHYLEENLFEPTPDLELTPRTGDVRLSCAYGEEAEAHRVVTEVQSALEAGIAARDVLVVFRDVAPHFPSLARAFDDAGILVDFDFTRSIRATAWGRAFSHLVAFSRSGGRADLTAFLRSAYSGAPRDLADVLDARWRAQRVHDPAALLASLSREAPRAATLVRQTATLFEHGGRDDYAVKWQELTAEMLRHAFTEGSAGVDAQIKGDAAARRAFLELLAETSGLIAEAVSFYDLVEDFLDTRVATRATSGRVAVQVRSAVRARSERFPVVIVGGLSAGDFPPAVREDPLRVPEVARELSRLGLDLNSADEHDKERLTFYLIASRATKRLVLSRQVASSEGSELAASWLLDELLDLYRNPEEEVDEALLPPATTLGFNDSMQCGSSSASARRTLRACAIAGPEPTDAAARERLREARERGSGRQPALIDQEALKELAAREVFSATEIESYLGCPYNWFYERVVKPRSIEPDADALEVGTLGHEALRRVFERLPAEIGATRVTERNLPDALRCASAVIAELISEQGDVATLAQVASHAAVRRKVLGFLKADAAFMTEFEPVSLEFEFETEPGLFSGFILRGRIDRIDRGPEGELIVSDYKTGRVSADHGASKLERSGKVQAPLYARAAEASIGSPVGAALYRTVSWANVSDKLNRGFYVRELGANAGLVSTDAVDAEAITEVVADAERRASEAVAGMRAGDIRAQPRDEKACTTCAIRRACSGATQ